MFSTIWYFTELSFKLYGYYKIIKKPLKILIKNNI